MGEIAQNKCAERGNQMSKGENHTSKIEGRKGACRSLAEQWEDGDIPGIKPRKNFKNKKVPDATELRDHEKKSIRGSTFTCRGHCQNVRPCLW